MSNLKETYQNNKEKILSDRKIFPFNREIIKQHLERQEKVLCRRYGLQALDEANYKTLKTYFCRYYNLNRWLKDWKNLNKAKLEKFYNDLEEGRIKTQKGERFKDRNAYYDFMLGDLFGLIEIDSEKEAIDSKTKKRIIIIEKRKLSDIFKDVLVIKSKCRPEEVRFFEGDIKEMVKKLEKVAIKPEHKLLLWLAFDTGENISSLLKLEKSDFTRQKNKDTKEPEYRYNFRKEILKRTRRARGDITLFPETIEILDLIIPKLRDNEKVFKMGYKSADKFLKRAVKIINAKVSGNFDNPSVSWKDFRSSLACYLLQNGYSAEEINDRLGHKISSRVIDRYADFLAMDKHEPKRKVFAHDTQALRNELEETKTREKLLLSRFEKMKDDSDSKNKLLYLIAKDKLAELKGEKREEFSDMLEDLKKT